MLAPELESSGPDLAHENQACLSLWAAVLRQGISDTATSFFTHGNLSTKEGRWFLSDEDYVGSFVWLCELLGFSPDSARSAARGKFRELAVKHEIKRAKHAKAKADGRVTLETKVSKPARLQKRGKGAVSTHGAGDGAMDSRVQP